MATDEEYNFTYAHIASTWHYGDDRGFKIAWGCNGVGFGEVTVWQDEEGLNVDTEYMGDKFIKALLEYVVKSAKVHC
jgi:hypothetical protein